MIKEKVIENIKKLYNKQQKIIEEKDEFINELIAKPELEGINIRNEETKLIGIAFKK